MIDREEMRRLIDNPEEMRRLKEHLEQRIANPEPRPTEIAILPQPERFDLMAYELLNGPFEGKPPIQARDRDGNELGYTLQEHLAKERPTVLAAAIYGDRDAVQLVGFDSHAFSHGVYGFEAPFRVKGGRGYDKRVLIAEFVQKAVETSARTIMIRKLINP